MIIRQASSNDIDALVSLFEEARATIATLGIDQWQNGYPSRSVIQEDIAKERSFVVEIEGTIIGTFVIITDGEPTYDRIFDGAWLTGESRAYFAIHRVAIALSCRGQGIAPAIMAVAAEQASAAGCASLRIDTHRGNVVMRRMLEKNGYRYCGVIHLADGAERVAYEKIIGKGNSK